MQREETREETKTYRSNQRTSRYERIEIFLLRCGAIDDDKDQEDASYLLKMKLSHDAR